MRVEFDPNDSTVIYVVLGGYAGSGPPGHVFRTTVGGTVMTAEQEAQAERHHRAPTTHRPLPTLPTTTPP